MQPSPEIRDFLIHSSPDDAILLLKQFSDASPKVFESLLPRDLFENIYLTLRERLAPRFENSLHSAMMNIQHMLHLYDTSKRNDPSVYGGFLSYLKIAIIQDDVFGKVKYKKRMTNFGDMDEFFSPDKEDAAQKIAALRTMLIQQAHLQ